jgi:branched-chain amino acid transport system substrate-binding protein
MMRRRNLTTALAVLVLGMASVSAASGTKLQGAPIKLGSIASCSGPLAPSLGGTCDVLEAWEKYTNANGVINGHPVDLTVVDDGGVPARGQAAAKRLVEGDKVIAIVGEYSLVASDWADYVTKKGVPVVGGTAGEAPFLVNPDFFASGAQPPTLLYGLVSEAKKRGKTKLGVLYCAEAPACAGLPSIAERLSKLIGGIDVAYSNKVSATAPNYTAVCLAAKEAGVDALYTAAATQTVQRLRAQCAQQGYKPLLLGTPGTADNPKDPNFDGAVSVLSNLSIADTSTPAGKAFNDAIDTYAKSVREHGSQFNNSLTSPWAGGELFTAAAAKAKLGPDSTPADVKRGLYALTGDTLRGMAPPLTYEKGKAQLVSCYFVQKIANGKLVAEYHAKYQCIPKAQVPAVLQALAG